MLKLGTARGTAEPGASHPGPELGFRSGGPSPAPPRRLPFGSRSAGPRRGRERDCGDPLEQGRAGGGHSASTLQPSVLTRLRCLCFSQCCDLPLLPPHFDSPKAESLSPQATRQGASRSSEGRWPLGPDRAPRPLGHPRGPGPRLGDQREARLGLRSSGTGEAGGVGGPGTARPLRGSGEPAGAGAGPAGRGRPPPRPRCTSCSLLPEAWVPGSGHSSEAGGYPQNWSPACLRGTWAT